MKTLCVVYTAMYGAYDHLRPVPQIPGVEFVVFTDDPELKADGWEVRYAPAPPDEHPRMSAKWYKMHPHRAFPDIRYTLWIDANEQLKTPGAVQGALDCATQGGIAVHRHPGRKCIYEEADLSIRMLKYATQPIEKQVEAYRAEGHPENWGLWQCGVIASIRGPADKILEAWWEENVTWTYQDQISLPVVLRRAGLRPAEFPHNHLSSPWFAIGGHNRED